MFCFNVFSSEILCKSETIENGVTINEQNEDYIIFTVKTSNLEIEESLREDKIYHSVDLIGAGYNVKEGAPLLPQRTINLATSVNPDFKITILEKDIEVFNGYNVIPGPKPYYGVDTHEPDQSFVIDESIYSSNINYPKEIIELIETQTYRGIPISRISVAPIQFNPVTKSIKVYKTLKVRIDYNSLPKTRLNEISMKSSTLLSNVVVNNKNFESKNRNSYVSDYSDDVLIITVDEFVEDAKKLAIWQRMKGYDVKLVSQTLWSVFEVRNTIKNFYRNTTPKPGYVLIIGDVNHIPVETFSKPGGYNYSGVTDKKYMCMDGANDYMPEMASGRISIANAGHLRTIVNKIIDYEKNPVEEESFYKKTVACSEWQVDRAFVQNIEKAKEYLDNNWGYESERIYYNDNGVAPGYFPATIYSELSYLSDELRNSNWNGNPANIINAFNDGAFLFYHYDHGYANGSGWVKPKFTLSNGNSLTNGNKLPVVFSINCCSGKFDNANSRCLAEMLMRKNDGGAVGVVAPTQITYSGPNDGLLLGLVDAIWPGEDIVFKSPKIPNPIVTEHFPIYTMGDVLDQGLFRMTETWNYWNAAEAHYYMYHWHGDPTMRIWTEKPKDITANINVDAGVPIDAQNINISDLSINDGVVTLYNLDKDIVVGKASISSNSVNVPIENSPNTIGEKIVCTITSHNYKPLIVEMNSTAATENAYINNIANNFNISIKGNKLYLQLGEKKNINIEFYNVKGALIKNVTLNNDNRKRMIDINKLKIANGSYVVQMTSGDQTFRKAFVFNR